VVRTPNTALIMRKEGVAKLALEISEIDKIWENRDIDGKRAQQLIKFLVKAVD
jgi:hypothetical protein